MGGCRSWLQRVMDAMVSLSSFLADPSLRWAYEVDYLETQVQGAFSLPLRSIWFLWVLTRNHFHHFHPLFFIIVCNVRPIFCVVLLCSLRKRSMFHVLLSGIPRLVRPKAWGLGPRISLEVLYYINHGIWTLNKLSNNMVKQDDKPPICQWFNYYGFFIPTKHGTIGDGGSARLSSKSPRIRLCEDPKRHLQGQSLWQSCLRPVPPSKWTKMSCQSCHEFSIVFWYLGIAIQFPWDPIKKTMCHLIPSSHVPWWSKRRWCRTRRARNGKSRGVPVVLGYHERLQAVLTVLGLFTSWKFMGVNSMGVEVLDTTMNEMDI